MATINITAMEAITILDQLADGTATSEDGEHLIAINPWVRTNEGVAKAIDMMWAVHDGALTTADVHVTCGVTDCIRLDHLTVQAVTTTTDEEILDLVQRASINLAQMYRKGRARGFFKRTTEYGG